MNPSQHISPGLILSSPEQALFVAHAEIMRAHHELSSQILGIAFSIGDFKGTVSSVSNGACVVTNEHGQQRRIPITEPRATQLIALAAKKKQAAPAVLAKKRPKSPPRGVRTFAATSCAPPAAAASCAPPAAALSRAPPIAALSRPPPAAALSRPVPAEPKP